ncbi:hypothetical protein Tco_0772075 [Tanacetum coccineum]|uniref:Uncharacterized protein n=1 Tax=Tanacetum coccineum TaxID=301880 RepID=A0ABQ4ZGX7_9ASTR
MLQAMKDEAGGNLNEEENDFMLDNAYGDDTLEELNAAVIMIACIQPPGNKADAEANKQMLDVNHEDNNGGIDEHDSNAHNQSVALDSLIYNVQEEAKKSIHIQATMEQRIKILENDFKRAEAQYVNLDLKIQHQKENLACDVSWKSRMTKLSNENLLLKTKVESVVQERENIKLEFQNLFNSHQSERRV